MRQEKSSLDSPDPGALFDSNRQTDYCPRVAAHLIDESNRMKLFRIAALVLTCVLTSTSFGASGTFKRFQLGSSSVSVFLPSDSQLEDKHQSDNPRIVVLYPASPEKIEGRILAGVFGKTPSDQKSAHDNIATLVDQLTKDRWQSFCSTPVDFKPLPTRAMGGGQSAFRAYAECEQPIGGGPHAWALEAQKSDEQFVMLIDLWRSMDKKLSKEEVKGALVAYLDRVQMRLQLTGTSTDSQYFVRPSTDSRALMVAIPGKQGLDLPKDVVIADVLAAHKSYDGTHYVFVIGRSKSCSAQLFVMNAAGSRGGITPYGDCGAPAGFTFGSNGVAFQTRVSGRSKAWILASGQIEEVKQGGSPLVVSHDISAWIQQSAQTGHAGDLLAAIPSIPIAADILATMPETAPAQLPLPGAVEPGTTGAQNRGANSSDKSQVISRLPRSDPDWKRPLGAETEILGITRDPVRTEVSKTNPSATATDGVADNVPSTKEQQLESAGTFKCNRDDPNHHSLFVKVRGLDETSDQFKKLVRAACIAVYGAYIIESKTSRKLYGEDVFPTTWLDGMTFQFDESSEINAQFRGGPLNERYVWVANGLLSKMTTEQLAWVLAHELGHGVMYHATKRQVKKAAAGAVMLGGVAGIATGAVLLGGSAIALGTSVFSGCWLTGYSLTNEKLADLYGVSAVYQWNKSLPKARAIALAALEGSVGSSKNCDEGAHPSEQARTDNILRFTIPKAYR